MSLISAMFVVLVNSWATAGESPDGDKKVFGKSEEGSFADKVVVIKIGMDELSDEHRYNFVRRSAKRAEEEGAKAVIFDLNTPGGYAWETAEFLMQDLASMKVRTIAYVNPSAVSAGAIIALGTDEIYMAPAATIGAAGVVTHGYEMGEMERAKAESYLITAVRGVAKKKGRDPNLASAMMDLEFIYENGDIVFSDDELMSLDSEQATKVIDGKPLLAKGIAADLADLMKQENLSEYEMVTAEPSGMEKIAFWVASVSALLIMVGIGGAYLEMKTPGFGIGGGISLLAFGLFFFGNYLAGNMVGYGLLVLFVLGVILVVVEFVVLPGTIIPGVVGGIMILVSLFIAMIDNFAFEDNSVSNSDNGSIVDIITGPSLHLAIGIIGSTVLLLLLMRFLPDVPLFSKLVMGAELSKGAAMDDEDCDSVRAGMQGVAVTDLRPSGKAKFGSEILDVTASVGLIEEGAAVAIKSEDGMGIVVSPVE
ncbi:MAG: NfeD family protein [Akkermansiaceae bacterium]